MSCLQVFSQDVQTARANKERLGWVKDFVAPVQDIDV
jgi:hypothetical protein